MPGVEYLDSTKLFFVEVHASQGVLRCNQKLSNYTQDMELILAFILFKYL